MSIDPVRASKPGIELPTPEKKVHVAPPQPGAASGTTPKTEIVATQNASVPLLIPEHEVKVQLDTAADDIVIYQVLDKQSGNLVLQVPSAEQLRGIHQTQELLQQIAARAGVLTSDRASAEETSAAAVKGEGSNNGRKL
jgi:hypothetical protein